MHHCRRNRDALHGEAGKPAEELITRVHYNLNIKMSMNYAPSEAMRFRQTHAVPSRTAAARRAAVHYLAENYRCILQMYNEELPVEVLKRGFETLWCLSFVAGIALSILLIGVFCSILNCTIIGLSGLTLPVIAFLIMRQAYLTTK